MTRDDGPEAQFADLARPNVFEIDLAAIAENVRRLRRQVGANVRLYATLKANAYGYGLLPVARTVIPAGADAIAVGSLWDGVVLRRAGLRVPVLVYASSIPDETVVRAFEANDLIATLHNRESFDAYARLVRRPLGVAVKIDVGPERIGVPVDEAAEFIERVSRTPGLRLEVVNAHPGVPALGDVEGSLAWQYERFSAVLRRLHDRGVEVPWRLFASSKVLHVAGAGMALNAVDPGSSLFAGDADGSHQPFRVLRSRLVQVRTVARDRFLDEAPFPMKPGMRVGVMPFGTSDGIVRMNVGAVLVRGRRAPLLGPPSLEYARIGLDGIDDASVGDEVVVIGRQGDERIAPEDVMRAHSMARVADIAMEMRPSVVRRYLPAS